MYFVFVSITMLYIYFGFIRKTKEKRLQIFSASAIYIFSSGLLLMIFNFYKISLVSGTFLAIGTFIYFYFTFILESKNKEEFSSLFSWIFRVGIGSLIYGIFLCLILILN